MSGAGPSVLLTTEGTYPFHRGGVSTWCDALTRQLSEVDFRLLAVTMHPYMASQYRLSPNVSQVIRVPLWGTEDPAEYGQHASLPDYLQRRWDTRTATVETRFLPHYEQLLQEVLVAEPGAAERLAGVLLQLHLLFQEFDYHRAHTHRSAWEAFDRITRAVWEASVPSAEPPTAAEVRDAWRLFYRLLIPVAIDVPRTDLTHSAAAAFCGIPCVLAKLRWGTPYLLTEHGIYLREQYLNLGRRLPSLFVRWFLFRLVGAVADLNYAFADQLSPVCAYNTRWERWRNVDPRRIRVIYNGVDPVTFAPGPRQANSRPTVVSVGLIFPLKGQLDLVDAAATLRGQIPDVQFLIYGSASDEAYYKQCERRVRALGLQDHVSFMGRTDQPWSALRQADVVALPSISEAFPYALVEAMLTEAAIVANDVGGVREALGDTGVLVPAHDPASLSAAIGRLLQSDPGERERMGRAARARALHWFTEQKFVDAYRASYLRLAGGEAASTTAYDGAETSGEAGSLIAIA